MEIMVESVGWHGKTEKSEYTHSESMVELVAWFRVGTDAIYVWK